MSDIQYDTRTGAVMAGGLTGSGHKPGALVKQQLATIRAACREANSRSNQDLILLLENYNDQVDQVIEALRSGDADGITGGWATTVSKKGKTGGKGKKTSESDTVSHGETNSVNNHKVPSQPAPSQSVPQPVKQKNNSNQGKQQSQQNQGEETSRPALSASTHTNGQQKENKKKPEQTVNKTQQNVSVQPPKDVPIPNIHTHHASFRQLSAQLAETHADDLKKMDFAFEQLRRTLDLRHETLRRTLDQNHQESLQSLEARHRQSAELSNRVTQAGALSPTDNAQLQNDIFAFTDDYKLDLHLAATPKFVHTGDNIQKELNKFGSVATIQPAYSYQATAAHLRPENSKPLQQSKAAVTTTVKPVPHQQTQTQTQTTQNKNVFPERNLVSEQQHQAPPKQDYARSERVTIVPKNLTSSSAAAPLGSLVISGGNLTAEEMAALTRSLENSLRYPTATPTPTVVKPIGPAIDGGDTFSTPDVFSEGAIWTNSTAAFTADQWNPDTNVAGIRPIGEPTLGSLGSLGSFGNQGQFNGGVSGGFRGSVGGPRRGDSGIRGGRPGRGGRGGPRGRGARGSS